MSARRRGRGRGPRASETTVAAPPAAPESPLVDAAVAGETPAAAPRREPRQAANGPAQRRGNDGAPRREPAAPRWQPKPPPQPVAEAAPSDEAEPLAAKSSCTLAQMRRFIKSRPYVPVHELRRRFLIDGIEDEVSPMPTGKGTLFVGLPEREAGFLGELVKAGEVGCELLLDPTSPGVIGVFPMRPVARQ